MFKNKPNFLIVGAAKSGSTSLYHYLNQHPEVFMPTNKEPNFLVSAYQKKTSAECPSYIADRRRMVFSLEDYKDLFEGAEYHKAIGEATVTYLYKPDIAIPNIKELLDDPKILIILRNPITRAFSQYSYCVELGFENLTFEEAIMAEPKRLKDNWSSTFAYIDQGRFANQVKSYLDNFSNVKIIILEEFVQNKQKTLKSVYDFIRINDDFENDFTERFNSSGVPRIKFIQSLLVHNNPIKSFAKKVLSSFISPDKLRSANRKLRRINQGEKLKMTLAQKEQLEKIYEYEIFQVEQVLGRRIDAWH